METKMTDNQVRCVTISSDGKEKILPVFDADVKPVHLGNVLEWVETSGPYGQTQRKTGTVTHKLLMCGSIVTNGGLVKAHWEWRPKDGPEGFYCRHENHSYDHGHKTWARVVVKANPIITEVHNAIDGDEDD
jgi:hypothetical protein